MFAALVGEVAGSHIDLRYVGHSHETKYNSSIDTKGWWVWLVLTALSNLHAPFHSHSPGILCS